MAGTLSRTHHTCVDADSIVANSQYELALFIVQPNLDASSLGMLSRVSQGFSGDTVHIVTNEWRDGPSLPFHDDTE